MPLTQLQRCVLRRRLWRGAFRVTHTAVAVGTPPPDLELEDEYWLHTQASILDPDEFARWMEAQHVFLYESSQEDQEDPSPVF